LKVAYNIFIFNSTG